MRWCGALPARYWRPRSSAERTLGEQVWSFGCVLACMHVRRNNPYSAPSNELRRRVMEGDLRPHVPATCPFAELVDLCGQLSDLDRPSFAELLAKLEGPSVQQLAAQAGVSQPADLSVCPLSVPSKAVEDKMHAPPQLFTYPFPTPGEPLRSGSKV